MEWYISVSSHLYDQIQTSRPYAHAYPRPLLYTLTPTASKCTDLEISRHYYGSDWQQRVRHHDLCLMAPTVLYPKYISHLGKLHFSFDFQLNRLLCNAKAVPKACLDRQFNIASVGRSSFDSGTVAQQSSAYHLPAHKPRLAKLLPPKVATAEQRK